MKTILISSNFTDEIQNHHESSEADVLPPSSSEEEKIDIVKIVILNFDKIKILVKFND